MVTKEDMEVWFRDRYEIAGDAEFYEAKVGDHTPARPIDARMALQERFPSVEWKKIEDLANELEAEGQWVDIGPENP